MNAKTALFWLVLLIVYVAVGFLEKHSKAVSAHVVTSIGSK